MRKALLCLSAILVTAASVYPQSASQTLDHVEGIVNPAANGPIRDSVFAGKNISFWIRLTNNTGANITDDPDDKVHTTDLTYLTEYLFGSPNGPAPMCMEEANVNADPDGSVNISDLTYLVCHLFCAPPGPATWDCM